MFFLTLLVATSGWAGMGGETEGDVFADTWVATDALGRSLPTFAEVGPPRAGKQVGLFYFLWVNNGVTNKSDRPVFDITKILAANPEKPQWGPVKAFHFWGEPELGYYTINDPFVLARHRSMLTAAGVDVLFFDQTNALVYPKEMLAVCEALDQGRRQGLPVPKVAGIHNTKPELSVAKLYDALYAPKKYPELWFRWLGKPLLLSPTEKLSAQAKEFFTLRHTWAWSQLKWFGDGRDKWTWVDWFPQKPGWHESPDKPEQISVTIAPHPLHGRGRSFTGGQKTPPPAPDKLRTNEGLYAAQQWKRALEVDPQLILVTGWNEWIAQRFVWGNNDKPEYAGFKKLGPGDSYFVDQYNQEFSRDAEPMKGGHGDNYYYQLVAHIRRYKGVRAPEVPVAKAIVVDGDFADWQGVRPEYRDFIGDTLHRDHTGWNKSIRYSDTTGRNDIVRAHVSPGRETVAFHVVCAANITKPGAAWMRLYLDADQDARTGWHGHDLVVNRAPPNAAGLSVHRLRGDQAEELGRVAYAVKGKELELALPREWLGGTGELRFDFKWADNQQKDDDIEEFARHGDAAPDRRFNYRYDQGVTEERIKVWTQEAERVRREASRR